MFGVVGEIDIDDKACHFIFPTSLGPYRGNTFINFIIIYGMGIKPLIVSTLPYFDLYSININETTLKSYFEELEHKKLNFSSVVTKLAFNNEHELCMSVNRFMTPKESALFSLRISEESKCLLKS